MNSLLQCSDEKLCSMAQQGIAEAEEQLAARYSRLVRAYARPYFLVGGDSEDLIQEGMIGLLSAIRGFDPTGAVPFRAYAETCVRNRLYSAIRTAMKDKNFPLNSSVSLDIEEDMDRFYSIHWESPEETLIGREEHLDRLQGLLRELSPLERQILDRYLEGYSYAQIADRIGKPLKAVDNAVQRIRRKATAYLSSGDNSES